MNEEMIERLADEYIKYLKIRLFIRSDLRWIRSENTYDAKQFYNHYSLAKCEATIHTLKIMGFEMDEIDENSALQETTYSISYNGKLIRGYYHIPFSEIEFGYNPLDMLLRGCD